MDKIKLNIHSNHTVPTANWEKGFDAINNISQAKDNGWIDEESTMSGTFHTPVAPPSKVKKLNDEYDIEIITNDNLQQFEDKEVCKVIAANAGGGNLILKTAFKNLSLLDNWFGNNKNIVEFLELRETKITSITQRGCFTNSSIKKINFDKIEILQGSGSLDGCYFSQIGDYPHVGYFPNLKQSTIGWNNTFLNSLNDIYAYFLPSIETVESISSYGTHNNLVDSECEFVDFGKNYYNKQLCHFANGWGSFSISGYYKKGFVIVRSSCEEVESIRSAPKYIYLTASAKEKVDAVISSSNDTSYVTRVIGGMEWQNEMRILADKYAKELAGWTDEEIANADYSDPYIDYDIFGVPRPTE